MTGTEIKEGTELWIEASHQLTHAVYGQSETTMLCGNFPGNPVKPGSMGLPAPGVPVNIIDDDGQICDTGVEGDIAVAMQDPTGRKVHCLFEGYLQRDGTALIPTRLAKGSTKSLQWYVTGDRGYQDKDGYLWFAGRSDDVINSSGYRIGKLRHGSKSKIFTKNVQDRLK